MTYLIFLKGTYLIFLIFLSFFLKLKVVKFLNIYIYFFKQFKNNNNNKIILFYFYKSFHYCMLLEIKKTSSLNNGLN